jgi:hypothetical protein
VLLEDEPTLNLEAESFESFPVSRAAIADMLFFELLSEDVDISVKAACGFQDSRIRG